MKELLLGGILLSSALCGSSTASAEALVSDSTSPVPPIETVSVGENREFLVNGKVFFPIMSFLQNKSSHKMLRGMGINTFVGNHGFTASDHCVSAQEAGGYAVPLFGANVDGVIGHPNLLGWLQPDEPDLAQRKSDGVVEAGSGMSVNPRTPFSRIVDGKVFSTTVLEPLLGGSFTIKRKSPVTVTSLAVWATVPAQGNMPVAKRVVFRGDGKELLTAELEKRRGQQRFELPTPATFSELNVAVVDVYPGGQKWGSIGEVEGFDVDGKNVLLSPEYVAPRQMPEEIAERYALIKRADNSRPVFLTLCAYFMREHGTDFTRTPKGELYPRYVQAADVVGYDIYPIYGEGVPGKINWPAYAMRQLRDLTGPTRPTYAWIETSKGSQWLTYEKQPDVLPEHTRFEVWGAIIEGATAIGYFTHAWRPTFKEFAPTKEMQAELKRLNAQLTRLAPEILAPLSKRRINMTIEGDLPCHFKATERDGILTIFAQNQDLGVDEKTAKQFQPIYPRSGKATLAVAGLKAGTAIEVIDEKLEFEGMPALDENRVITAFEGGFSDEFGPLAEHIYRLRP